MHPTLTIAKRAAYAAGSVIAKNFEIVYRIERHEKNVNDFVTDVDLLAEQEIINIISTAYPEHNILSEERGMVTDNQSEYLWVIDPLDGTTNFIKGIAHFAVSIALLKNGKLESAIVYQPINDELFAASKGQGATLNDRKIRASKELPINAIIATGTPYRKPDLMPKQQAYLRDTFTYFPDIRRFGAASLDLCFVACARFDGYFEIGLEKWDIAAGALIAQESGAIVSDTKGGFDYLSSGNIVCAPQKVYKELIKITRK